MKLRISNSDPKVLEDEMGNPMFRYVGIHPSDVEALVNELRENENLRYEVDELQSEVDKLEDEIEDLEAQL